ncbi:MAG TPA: uracil-DNA glycosylase [Tepidisphaeraceae bacterium]|jgi:uracil-DNA glycosylase family 4|nr:uracil-DNA glycosylase [Tepidisphaeraceae bacterium]
MTTWDGLQKRIIGCRKCPRLRQHCRTIARDKRAAFRDWTYWGRPLPNLGLPTARLLIVGLAPAAHGGNRTGRMFTGDRSGDFLFRALYETGFATQPTSTHAGDGLELIDVAITAMAHCAPPDNKPTPEELDNCFPFLEETVDFMPRLGGIVALGRIGFDGALRLYRSRKWLGGVKRPAFGHGALYEFPQAPFLLASFHPSQQNTFTGKLTAEMMRAIFHRARELLDASEPSRAKRSATAPESMS